MDFLLGIMVGIGIGFLWGVWRATQSMIERMVHSPEEIKDLMEKIDRTVREEHNQSQSATSDQEYRTEWHQGVCYLYDHNDNFMAQGSDIIEAMKNAEQRFPGLKLNFRINDPDKSNQ